MASTPVTISSSLFALIDLETSGGNSRRDRVIEVGLRLWRGHRVEREWQTLVNPGTRIPQFIEQLTGITNDMVSDAPPFSEIAHELASVLDGAIFVAHNARFDHAFLKTEFERVGIPFTAKVLCTVKLARQLYPGHRRYNMDTLIERHGLPHVARHRAMGDVKAMQALFETALRDHGDEPVEAAIHKLLKRPSLPSHLPPNLIDQIPRCPGVYRFYGEKGVLLYVGMSRDIRQRVTSHFSGDHLRHRSVRMSESLRDVDWIETAGVLGAALEELRQIKTLSPMFNRRSRAAKRLWSLRLIKGEGGYLEVQPVHELDPSRLGDFFGLFRSKKDATKALKGLSEKNQLCHQKLGLEPAQTGPCFQRKLGRCQGACESAEDVERYNLRMRIAFHRLRLETWPWDGAIAVVEHDPGRDRTDYLVIYNWIHWTTVHDEADLYELELDREQLRFDLDAYKLIVKQLLDPGVRLPIIELPYPADKPEAVTPLT